MSDNKLTVQPAREEILLEVLREAEPGDRIAICRSDGKHCPKGTICEYCARIYVERGMTPADILARAKLL